MKNFIVYIENGQIVRNGTCQDETFDYQAGENEFVLESDAAYNTHYVEDGVVVEMPPKPDGDYKFDYNVKQWVYDTAKATADALTKRQKLLLDSDYTQLPDVPLTDKQSWADYRQQLRDITSQPNFPNDIIWPTPPTEGA